MATVFYTESVDIDKCEELPISKIYAQYAGFKKYGLIFKPENMGFVLNLLKQLKIRKPEFKERKLGEWNDRLGNFDHFYFELSISSFDKIRESDDIAFELSFD